MEFTPLQCLPLYARIAIERLQADSNLRSGGQLNQLLDAYARTYAIEVDDCTRASAHHICAQRFGTAECP
jgi:hypothetical protein